jgi:Domain of unknown function (DUF4400)
MRLVWLGGLVLLFASVASLVSKGEGGRLLEEGWARAANVLPDVELGELELTTPAYTTRIFRVLPEPFRQKLAAKMWTAVEVMIFRSLLLWHLTPAFLMSFVVGSLEGSWARASQKTLIKMHSPMRFSSALTTLGLIPVLTLLWVAAPAAISAAPLIILLGTIAIFGTRNLIVHAPTQF